MVFDVVITPDDNNQSVAGCVQALHASRYNLRDINVFVVNRPGQHTQPNALDGLEAQFAGFGKFEVISLPVNTPLAACFNAGAAKGVAPCLLFLSALAKVQPDTLPCLARAAQEAPAQTVAFECRQFPYEQAKYYHPVTLQTPWCSAAALVVKRPAFVAAGGFDDTLLPCCMDVDISWRLRMQGGHLAYCPDAAVDLPQAPQQNNFMQTAERLAGNLALRHKFATKIEIAEWDSLLEQNGVYTQNPEFMQLLEQKLQAVNKMYRQRRSFWKKHVKHSGFKADFLQENYAVMRPGADVKIAPVQEGPLFSVLVRTCGRPAVLQQTLCSLRHQCYKNFEVVVVEDGEATAKDMLANGFAGLSLQYHATGQHVGRSAAGNLAMQMAKGEFFNFLDDDDYLFADHLEHMAGLVAQNPGAKWFGAGALEAACRYPNGDLAAWEVERMSATSPQKVTFLSQVSANRFPIQTVSFHRSLFAQMGGFDESLDALEDWELWVRYMHKEPIVCSPKATSMFKTPADFLQMAHRLPSLLEVPAGLRKRFEEYPLEVNAAQLLAERDEAYVQSQIALYRKADELVHTAQSIYQSTSWKLTRWLRALQRKMVPAAHRNDPEYGYNIVFMDPATFSTVKQFIQYNTYARASLSWRITKPLRKLARGAS